MSSAETASTAPGRIPNDALDQLFRAARTHITWRPDPVPAGLLRELYDLARFGPTSANSSPARFVFLADAAAKGRLIPALYPGNVEKAQSAPVIAIIAWDSEFYEQLPKLMPFGDFRSHFVGNQPLIDETAFRNSSLQGAYFLLAARALGLDCGPMSGFDVGKVNAEFFPDGKWKANFLCSLGYGDRDGLRPRSPRLEFDEACRVL